MDNNSESREEVVLALPEGETMLMYCTYVHGFGLSVRSSPIPALDPDDLQRWIVSQPEDIHSTNTLWVFTGIFPRHHPGKVFHFLTLDQEQADTLISFPVGIAMVGAGDPVADIVCVAESVPLDPVTGDGRLAIAEHNDWITCIMNEDWTRTNSMFGEVRRMAESGFDMDEMLDSFLSEMNPDNNNNNAQEGE